MTASGGRACGDGSRCVATWHEQAALRGWRAAPARVRCRHSTQALRVAARHGTWTGAPQDLLGRRQVRCVGHADQQHLDGGHRLRRAASLVETLQQHLPGARQHGQRQALGHGRCTPPLGFAEQFAECQQVQPLSRARPDARSRRDRSATARGRRRPCASRPAAQAHRRRRPTGRPRSGRKRGHDRRGRAWCGRRPRRPCRRFSGVAAVAIA